jgi:hypothetical protein
MKRRVPLDKSEGVVKGQFSSAVFPTPPLLLLAFRGSDANTRNETVDRNERPSRRFHQQHAQKSVALLADRTQSLMPTRTVFSRNQTQITGHPLTTSKTGNISQGQHEGQRGYWPHSWLGHEQSCIGVLLGGPDHRHVQRLNLLIQQFHYAGQIFSSSAGPRSRRQLVPPLHRFPIGVYSARGSRRAFSLLPSLLLLTLVMSLTDVETSRFTEHKITGLDSRTWLGRALRLPLSLIPREAQVRLLRGPLHGKKWIAGTHGVSPGSLPRSSWSATAYRVPGLSCWNRLSRTRELRPTYGHLKLLTSHFRLGQSSSCPQPGSGCSACRLSFEYLTLTYPSTHRLVTRNPLSYLGI